MNNNRKIIKKIEKLVGNKIPCVKSFRFGLVGYIKKKKDIIGLSLYGCNIKDIIGLSLYGCNIKDIEDITGLELITSLQTLILENNQIKEIKGLTSLSNIKD